MCSCINLIYCTFSLFSSYIYYKSPLFTLCINELVCRTWNCKSRLNYYGFNMFSDQWNIKSWLVFGMNYVYTKFILPEASLNLQGVSNFVYSNRTWFLSFQGKVNVAVFRVHQYPSSALQSLTATTPYRTSWQYNWKLVSVGRLMCQRKQHFTWVFFHNLSVKRSRLYNQKEQACSSVSTTLTVVSFFWKLQLFPTLI